MLLEKFVYSCDVHGFMELLCMRFILFLKKKEVLIFFSLVAGIFVVCVGVFFRLLQCFFLLGSVKK